MSGRRSIQSAILAMTLLLPILLSGCTIEMPNGSEAYTSPPASSSPSETIVQTATPAVTQPLSLQPSTFSIPDFYFKNYLEFETIHRIGNGGLELVSEERPNYLEQTAGRIVYDKANAKEPGIWIMDTETGEERRLMNPSHNYYDVHVGGDYMYYSVVTWDEHIAEKIELYSLYIPTGETRFVGLCSLADFAVLGEKVYYVSDVGGSYNELLCYDPSAIGNTAIASAGSITRLGGYGSCLYYQSADRWVLYDTEHGEENPIADLDPERYIVSYADNDCVIYQELSGSGARALWLRRNGEDMRIGNYSSSTICAYADNVLLYEDRRYPPNTKETEYFALDLRTSEYMPLNAKDRLGGMFAEGDFPRIKTSRARLPIVDELYDLFVVRQGYKGAKPESTEAHDAWLSIAEREADLALLAKPSPDEDKYLAENGVAVEMKPYGADTLAILGSPKLPVESLTADQVRAIFGGVITNWKEVGGPDHNIQVYEHSGQSESKRLYSSLVGDEYETPDYLDLGFKVVEIISDYVDACRDDTYAIGYSHVSNVRSYSADELRCFAVDGFLPTEENLINGSYPFTAVEYIAIRTDEPENSPARRLYDWIGCRISDEIISRNRMMPLH